MYDLFSSKISTLSMNAILFFVIIQQCIFLYILLFL